MAMTLKEALDEHMSGITEILSISEIDVNLLIYAQKIAKLEVVFMERNASALRLSYLLLKNLDENGAKLYCQMRSDFAMDKLINKISCLGEVIVGHQNDDSI